MIKKIATGFLAAVMIAGTVSTSVSAVKTSGTGASGTSGSASEINYSEMTFDEIYATKIDEDYEPVINYLTKQYLYPEDKLTDMIMVYEKYGYQLWYEYYTGEVALKNTATGQILFSNPYDINGSESKASAQVKQELLSQISLTYLKNGASTTMYSYVEAAKKSQIRLKNIKNGIRVEYTLGDEATIRLVPRLIEKTRFETLIMNKITNPSLKKKLSSEGFYTYYDITDGSYSESKVRSLIEQFPALERMACYVFDPKTGQSEGQMDRIENIIKTYCPEYTYDELEYDHDLTGYVNDNESLPFFKLGLEYTLSEEGLEVRIPANGIRFDESTFQLTSLSILPWMGAGSSVYNGYTFIPDGSGTIIRFEDITTGYNISGEMYGPDYSYHEITGQHAEIMRYPVFGVVSGTWDGRTEGYTAIITEGDTMAKLMSTHGGGQRHNYNSVYATFNPRPYDTYSLSGSTVTDKTATWTVTSSRRYTDSYRIKYIMLTDDATAQAANLTNYYEPSYVGMAKAYRNYLEKSGQLARLNASDIDSNIPLYIESFGATQTDGRFLSIPVQVDTALTTFEDVKTMYDELTAMGVKNINFKLTGFANGGIHPTVPYKLKWERVLGGNSGFSDLAAYSREKGFGLYPEFDFAYIHDSTTFDGMNLKKHTVKTIDNRYTAKRYYDAATQTWQSDFALAISPSVYDYFYSKFNESYVDYNANGISVSTLGSDLNSDFDEDDPYNREDSKNFTQEILAKMGESYDVMVSGGNAYTFKYADVILNMATESSKYMRASASIPFIGMVLHGYIKTAGEALNMESDIESALLHAIENGSSLYFILSYRNLEALKESGSFSNYYSVGYDVWKDEVAEYYLRLNDVLSDLQTKLIVDHDFITASRIPDDDEIQADEDAAKLAAEIAKAEKDEADRKALLASLLAQRRRELGMTVDDEEIVIPDDDEDISEDDGSDTDDGTDTDDNGNTSSGTVNKYLTTEGTVVRVEYEGGTSFILNYNSFAVTAVYTGTVYEIDSLGFVRIDG